MARYATTSAPHTREVLESVVNETYVEDVPDGELAPVVPFQRFASDHPWKMVGSTCTATRIFWFWVSEEDS